MSKPTKPVEPKTERTCTPTTHDFWSLDITPRQFITAGEIGRNPPFIEPKYLLYCRKCGQGRRVNG